LAAARCIPGDHIEFARQTRELLGPDPAISEEAVKEEQWGAFADPLIGDMEPVDVDRLPVVPTGRL